MTGPCHNVWRLLTAILCIGTCVTLAVAQDVEVTYEEEGIVTGAEGFAVENVWLPPNGEMPKTKAPAVELTRGDKPLPMSFTIDYTLATDYIFRGANLSEYDGEGTEDLNHQLGIGAEYDTQEFGVIGAVVWMNWYAGLDQRYAYIGSSNEVQEVDYTVYWRLPYTPLGFTTELGYSFLSFPNLAGDKCTHEAYVRLAWDDSAMWRAMGCDVQSSFLNPYLFYAMDFDYASGGQWLELGVKPVWAVADIPYAQDVPVLRAMYLQPKVALGADHRYWGRAGANEFAAGAVDPTDQSTRLANIVYEVELGYDLGADLGLPESYGTVLIASFIGFNQTFRDFLDDTLYGGVRVAWAW